MAEYIQYATGLREGAETIGGVAFKNVISGCQYVAIAASQTDSATSATGATGDYLKGILIVPSTTSPGEVKIKDGAGTAISIFKGGATSVADLSPIWIELGIMSSAGAWAVTTGANETAIAVGLFS